MTNKNKEEQIVILEELMEKVENKELDEKEILKIVLKCINCNYRDLLIKLLKKKGNWDEDGCFVIDKKDYKKNLICPKCQSSLIVLDKEFIKNNILKFI